MNLDDEPKIDCHAHVFDPARFPYCADTFYRPTGQEVATTRELSAVFAAHDVRGALLVGPDSGYGVDNRCLLNAVEHSDGRFRGIAVVPGEVSSAELRRLHAAGVRGVAFNAALHGLEAYARVEPLLGRLRDLDMLVDLQVQGDQLDTWRSRLERSRVRLIIDHCGRPDPREGLDQPGFRALLELSQTGTAFVKLSGFNKFSREPYPHGDVEPYVAALLADFGPERCV